MRKMILALALALSLSGCATGENASPYSAKETNFASMMIPHHEQAIVMSDLALVNTTNPALLQLAQQIKAAQGPEIEQMRTWGDVDTEMHSGHVMAGMLTDEEIAQLKSAKGVAFDRLFLEGMIKHHEGAIMMAEMILDSKNPEVTTLAQEIITAQQIEIDLMKSLLKS